MNRPSNGSSLAVPWNDDVISLQQINNNMARLLTPAICYVSVLMVAGLLGNTMVVYYYGIKSQKTAYNLFIVVLAMYDIVVCTTAMPYHISDMLLRYTFTNDIACKILLFIHYIVSFGSVLTLITIGVDRFRKICKPLCPKINYRKGCLLSICIVIVSVLLSWPTLILYGSLSVSVAGGKGRQIEGKSCAITTESSYQPYVIVFHGLHFVIFIILTGILIVLYSVIGRKILMHRKLMRKHKVMIGSKTEKTGNIDAPFSSITVRDDSTDKTTRQGSKIQSERGSADNTKNSENADNSLEPANLEKGFQTRREKNVSLRALECSMNKISIGYGLNKMSIRITLIMVTVTLVFVVSFLPYFSLLIWRFAKGEREINFLTGGDLVLFEIGTLSHLLNGSLNPWIYGAFNSAFRQFVLERLKRRCCKGCRG